MALLICDAHTAIANLFNKCSQVARSAHSACCDRDQGGRRTPPADGSRSEPATLADGSRSEPAILWRYGGRLTE